MYSDGKYHTTPFKAYCFQNRNAFWISIITFCTIFIVTTSFTFTANQRGAYSIAGKKFDKFFSKYFFILEDAILQDEDPFPIGIHAIPAFENIYGDMSETRLNEYEFFTDSAVEKLRKKHSTVVSNIPQQAEIDFYHDFGYVTVGGGENDFYSLLLVKQLRDLGSKAKIEVMIPPSLEKDPKLCNDLLPQLNATCIEMKTIIGVKQAQKTQTNRHFINTLAVLTSSFRKALFISPSTIPLHNPDSLFQSEVFEDYKLLLWPTVYRSTISPTFYKVAEIEVEKSPVRILNDRWSDIKYYDDFEAVQREVTPNSKQNFHDLKGTSPEYATDSNLYLIDKVENFDVLLLALYYTFDGPERYFPLLNLARSESNGDYLMAAAHYLKKSYYQNLKTADKIGEPIGHLNAITGHYNPIEDYEILQGKIFELSKQREAGDYSYDYFNDIRRPFNVFSCTPLFFHVEEAGLNPFKIINSGTYIASEDKIKKRVFGNHIKFYGIDFELKMTKLVNELLCSESSRINFKLFEGYNVNGLCSDFLSQRLQYLENTSDEYWDKYLFEKKGPYPVPDHEVSSLKDFIKNGYERDKNFNKTDVKRSLSIKL